MKENKAVFTVLSILIKLTFLMVAAYYIYVGALRCYDYGYRVFAEPPVSKENPVAVEITVTTGMKPKAMGTMLKANGLIRDENLFVLQYYASEHRKDLKSGTFELNTGMTVEEMLGTMTVKPEPDTDSEVTEDGETTNDN